jgi:hypothetical protein
MESRIFGVMVLKSGLKSLTENALNEGYRLQIESRLKCPHDVLRGAPEQLIPIAAGSAVWPCDFPLLHSHFFTPKHL